MKEKPEFLIFLHLPTAMSFMTTLGACISLLTSQSRTVFLPGSLCSFPKRAAALFLIRSTILLKALKPTGLLLTMPA